MRLLFPISALLAFCFSAACAAAALPAPEPIYQATARALNAAADRDLRDPEDRGPDAWGVPSPRMFRRLDVNADGVADWRVDYEHAPNPSLWCGTGGCRNELWVSRPGGGYQLAVQSGMRLLKLTPRREGARLDLDFHGSTCGGYGVQECPRSYVWNEAERAFTPFPASNGATWLAGGPRQLAPVDLALVPAEVRGAVGRMQASCRAAGGVLDDPASYVTRLPDVDGDARRDWLVGSLYASCQFETDERPTVTLPVTVLASAGRADGLTVALEQPQAEVSIDLAASPATAWVWRDGDAVCEYEKPCGRRMRWDAGAKRLVE